MSINDLKPTAQAIEQYIEKHLFVPDGLMYSYIDSYTGKPYDPDFITPIKAPRRAHHNPWAWWTYEDTIQVMSLYMDALLRRFELEGDQAALRRVDDLWQIIRKIYSCSQILGIGSFLRPYGGYQKMLSFSEPLGTDQASPLFTALIHYAEHADEATRCEITDMMLRTLDWYEQQGFTYFYYKSMIHEWKPPLDHAASYYLPAITWAATVSDDPRWARHRDERLKTIQDRPLHKLFRWGGEMRTLHRLLGTRFDEAFPPQRMQELYETCSKDIASYNEPNMTKRMHPESAEPGFKPFVQPMPKGCAGLGYAYSYTCHHGRTRPQLEATLLCMLAEHGIVGAAEHAANVLAARREVPGNFTHFASEDYDTLPETVHLYARSVGTIMVQWYRDYWMLRGSQSSR